MKSFLLKNILPVSIIMLFLSACKKDEEEPIPATPALSREFTLSYVDAVDESPASFGTLSETINPFLLDWPAAKNNAAFIHFGFGENIGNFFLLAPSHDDADIIFAGVGSGVPDWTVTEGLTFDVNAVPPVNFEALTKEFIEDKIPDGGFEGNNTGKINITGGAGKIFRFIGTENNTLKFKGYIKIVSVSDGNPKTAVIQVKYINK